MEESGKAALRPPQGLSKLWNIWIWSLCLVGGLEHEWIIFPLILGVIYNPNWLPYLSEGLKPPARCVMFHQKGTLDFNAFMCYVPQFSDITWRYLSSNGLKFNWPNQTKLMYHQQGRRHPFSEGVVDSSPQMSKHPGEIHRVKSVKWHWTSPNHGSQMGKVILVGNPMGSINTFWLNL